VFNPFNNSFKHILLDTWHARGRKEEEALPPYAL